MSYRSTGEPQQPSSSFPMRNSPQMLTTPATGNIRPRKKQALKPGFSPLDWARLTSSGKDLRGGITEFRRITMEEVAQHKKRDDCWMVIQGHVYNVTHYLDFHPGGCGQLMRAAGKDGTRLFAETHPWVNAMGILRECLIGFCAPSASDSHSTIQTKNEDVSSDDNDED